MTREEYVDRKKTQLDLWSADMDALEERARKGEIALKEKSHEHFMAMRVKFHEVAGKLESIKTATGDSLKQIKKDTENVWIALKASAAEFQTHFKNKSESTKTI